MCYVNSVLIGDTRVYFSMNKLPLSVCKGSWHRQGIQDWWKDFGAGRRGKAPLTSRYEKKIWGESHAFKLNHIINIVNLTEHALVVHVYIVSWTSPILPHYFPAHISCTPACQGKMPCGFARLVSKVEKVFLRRKTASSPGFQQSLLSVRTIKRLWIK